jgi:hypothetical protein
MTRESSKLVLRIIFAFLLQKFDQELEHEAVELNSGVIEVRGCHPVTKQVFFVYQLNKQNESRTSSVITDEDEL